MLNSLLHVVRIQNLLLLVFGFVLFLLNHFLNVGLEVNDVLQAGFPCYDTMHALLNRAGLFEALNFLGIHSRLDFVRGVFYLSLDHVSVVSDDIVFVPSLNHLAEQIVYLLWCDPSQPKRTSRLVRPFAFLSALTWTPSSYALFSALGVLLSPSDSSWTHHDLILLTFLSSLELEELVRILVNLRVILRHSLDAESIVPVRLSGASILRA